MDKEGVWSAEARKHQEQIGALVSRVAEVIAVIPSISSDDEGKSEGAIASLLDVISVLSRMARSGSQWEKLAFREHESSRLLKKFKRVAKQQQEVIELHEANLKEAEQARLQRSESERRNPTSDTATNTDCTHSNILKMEKDNSLLRETLLALREKETKLSQLEERLRGSLVENRKLRLVIKRAQGVIEAQTGLLANYAEAKKREKASKVSTPSRENTPIRLGFSERPKLAGNSPSEVQENAEPLVRSFPSNVGSDEHEVDEDYWSKSAHFDHREKGIDITREEENEDEDEENEEEDEDEVEEDEEEEEERISEERISGEINLGESFDLIQMHYSPNSPNSNLLSNALSHHVWTRS